MNKILHFFSLFLLFLVSHTSIFAQSIAIKGRIISNEDSSPVTGCVMTLNPGMQLSVTNHLGEFFIKTTAGQKELTTRLLGFKQMQINFNVYSDTTVNITLEVDPYRIKEVTILADSAKSIERTVHGNIILTHASLNEMPRIFSEPDLIKSIQTFPGVVQGRDGTADIFVRGGTPGQNVFLSNGCYFFLPSHLLGLTSSFDIDFIEKTELIKDYFPSDIGGGASSVVRIDYREARQDSADLQLRFGLLTSGLTFQIPFKKVGMGITGGIKRGNYSLYAPLLKTLLDKRISDFLPPNDYSFYDSYIKVTHSSRSVGALTYVFMQNYDNGSNSEITEIKSTDTLQTSETGFISAWTNHVHALQWILPVKGKTRWILDLNYNGISVQRENFLRSEVSLIDKTIIESVYSSYRFSPEVINIGSKVYFTREEVNFSYSGGIFYRFRDFTPNIIATDLRDEISTINRLVKGYLISEPAAFISGSLKIRYGWLVEGGFRLSTGIINNDRFVDPEPRLRLTHESSENFSQHINYVRLSQFDHSLESSNAGLRSVLWIPVTEESGPEISNVFSFGVNGLIKNYIWSIDLYYKTMLGMVDFKPGANFLYSTSIEDLLDNINGRAYGLETFIVKRIGRISGNFTYTFSRSESEWYSPEGRIWIPSIADRPHNINIALKYYWKRNTSLGFNWVYSSGLPATMYIHNSLSGRWFETKNNIRYPDYHKLDISVRRIFRLKSAVINLDLDVSNVYNRKNTFYLREDFDEKRKTFIYKNISLFPIMPTFSLSIHKSWNMN